MFTGSLMSFRSSHLDMVLFSPANIVDGPSLACNVFACPIISAQSTIRNDRKAY